MAYMEYDDPAPDADLRAERLAQLRADISPEEAEQEAGWLAVIEDGGESIELHEDEEDED